MAPLTNDIRRVLATKADRIVFGNGEPSPSVGREGDITVRTIKNKGVQLFIKKSNRWYCIPMYERLQIRDNLDRIVSRRVPKYNGEVGFLKNTKEFHFKQSSVDSIKYAGSTTKITRDVTDGNPTFQLGSSDAECFKITSTYASGAKGLSSVTFDTLSASATADIGQYYFNVDETTRMHLDDNALTITSDGTVTGDVSTFILQNKAYHASAMANTRTSIEFQQILNDVSPDSFTDSGKITVGTVGNEWGNTAAEQDSYMSFSVALNGTMSEYMKINSDGTVGVGTNKYLTLSDNEIDVSSGSLTVDTATSIDLKPGDNKGVTIDANCTATNSATNKGFSIDYDHTAIAASGQSISNRAIDITINSDTVTHVGAVNNFGIYTVVDGATSGVQKNYGYWVYSHSADENIGLYTKCTDGAGADIKMVSTADTGDYCTIAVGAAGETTIVTLDDDGEAAHLNIEADGHVEFDGCGVGFDITTVTYGDIVTGASADSGNNTDVDFRLGNKAKLTLTGGQTVGILGFVFPAVSGNFSLILSQDGSGTGVVTAYNAYESDTTDATGSATLLWAGGSNPTLTTTANKSDIISIYWDQGAQKAYTVISHNF